MTTSAETFKGEASKWVELSGVALYRHAIASSRSCGNSSFVTPCFNVVGFAGKYFERFVLSFPTKAGDRPVVPAGIRSSRSAICPARDSHGLLCRTHGLHVRKNRSVIDGLDQTCSKDRRGNPEDYIPRGDGGLKI